MEKNNIVVKGYIYNEITEIKSKTSDKVFLSCKVVVPNSCIQKDFYKTNITKLENYNDPVSQEFLKKTKSLEDVYGKERVMAAQYRFLKMNLDNKDKLDADSLFKIANKKLANNEIPPNAYGNTYINAVVYDEALFDTVKKVAKKTNSELDGLVAEISGIFTSESYEVIDKETNIASQRLGYKITITNIDICLNEESSISSEENSTISTVDEPIFADDYVFSK